MPVRMPRASAEAHSRPRRSRLLLVGLSVFVVFAAFAIIVGLAYQENARVPEGEPPLIKASTAPFKLAPDDPGGREVADQGEINQLLRDEPAPAPAERVLPLPEEPRAPVVNAALPEEPVTGADATGTAAQPPTTTADPASADSAASRPVASAGAVPEAEAALARLLANVEPDGSPTTPPAAAPVPPAAGSAAVAPERSERPRTTVAPTTVLPATAPPAVARVAGPSSEADEALDRLLAEVAGVPVSPGQASGAASEPARAVAAIAPAEPQATPVASQPAGFRIQLAAVRDERDARRAWADLVDDLGPLLADYRPFYERAATSNGVFYRIQVGPFADQRAADAMCAEVQRRKSGCFVVAP